MSDLEGAIRALRDYQRQADEDGVEVTVSRQALDEVLAALAAAESERDRALGTCCSDRPGCGFICKKSNDLQSALTAAEADRDRVYAINQKIDAALQLIQDAANAALMPAPAEKPEPERK